MNDQFGSGAGSGAGSGDSGNPKGPPKTQKMKPRKNSQLTAASDVLQVLLQNSKSQLSDGFLRWRLEQQWPEIVGQMISEQTLPAALERGTLHVWVKHPTWMQQLWYFQDAIKDKVNQHLDKNVVFQVRFTLSKRAATRLPDSEKF
jgi:predicted nucleic acid-binding Zn ribbon protein